VWGLWPTIGRSLVCFIISTYVAVLAGQVFMALFPTNLTQDIDIEKALAFDPTTLTGPVWSFFIIVRAFIGVVILAMMLPPRCTSFFAYFGPILPERRLVFKYAAIIMLLIGAQNVLSALLGGRIVLTREIEAFRAGGYVAAYWVALVIAAPLYEELLFRGFLFKGIAQSRLGGWAAILITAGAWTALHAQYSGFQLGGILIHGLYYGWVRLKTGSTGLSVLLHALGNAIVIIEAAIVVQLSG